MKVLKLRIDDHDDEFYQHELSCMDDDKKAKALRFVNPSDKKLCILGDHAARCLVSELAGLPAEDVRIGTGDTGAPYVKYPADTGLYCSISHSGEYAVACADTSPVGVDIEKISSFYPELADAFCAPDELTYAKSHGNEGLCRIWTVKEAFFKCGGTGIKDLGDVKSICVFDLPEGYEASAEEIDSQYILTVVSRK